MVESQKKKVIYIKFEFILYKKEASQMEKELTYTGAKEGGMLTAITLLTAIGVPMLQTPDKYIGLGLIGLSVVLVLVREYYKPN